ncbi:MAG TPA: hypothetical protein VFE14_18045 [Micromonosporaceae bacterium]|nr:hypothetical protein [Micromonosporaceae bacterium]
MAAVDAGEAARVDRASPGTAPRSPARTATTAGRRRWDGIAGGAFLLVTLYLTGRLWRDVPHTGLAANRHDQAFFEWMLAHGARVLTHFSDPFVTTGMNAPDPVNLMANTAILGLSIPMAPVTLLFGAHASFDVLLVIAYAATGFAWYYVLSRQVVSSPAGALLGAGFCAFAPGMVSHGSGHPNIVAQFLVPLLIWRTLRLAEPGRAVRNGVVLGLLAVWQAFINEEVLLLTALGLGLFLLVLLPWRPDLRRRARPFLAGLGVAALVAGVLLAYPLWVQFFGPGSYRGLRADIRLYGADLASYPAFARQSLAGTAASARGLAQNATEENAFLGWPLLILLAGVVWWLRRNAVAVALAVVAVAFAAVSFGPKIRVHGTAVASGPWRLVQDLPVLDSIVPTRFALAIVPPIGVLLALACAHVPKGAARYVLPALVAAALLPIAPKPLPAGARTPAPALFTDGTLRRYVDAGHSVVFVPQARSQYPDPLAWAAESGLSFRMAHGYFLGPTRDPGQRYAIFTAPPRPTSDLLNRVYATGTVPRVTAEMRAAAVDDLRYWRAAVLVLVPGRNADALRAVTTELLGIDPQWTDGAWLWDVRQIALAPSLDPTTPPR